MDVSFEPTMMQWGDGETNTQFQSSTSAFEKVPLPVTVSDVVNCQSDDDKIHLGMYSFATVRVCGRVVNLDPSANEKKFEICDHSEQDENNCETLNVSVYGTVQAVYDTQPGDIVIVLGRLRKFDNNVFLMAFGVVQVMDPKEAESFKLEAELAKHYYVQNLPERSKEGLMEEFAGTMLYNGSTARPDQAGATPANRQAFGGNSAVYNPSASRVLKIEDNASHGLSGTKLQIYNVIRTHQENGDTGMHISDIEAAVGNAGNFQADMIYLVNEGMLYNTVDDQHFAAV